MNLAGKLIVVIGATGGIGREVVKVLDSEGARLVLVSRTESELQSFVKSLKGKDHKYYSCNLADQKATEKLGQQIASDNPSINVMVNAAGIGVYKPIEEATLDEWNKSMDINVTSHFILVKALVENLKRTENSLVLSIGSGASVLPMAGRSLYCASKFAVRGLTLSLAEEFKGTKTSFCLINLGSVLTSFGPMSFEEKRKEMESGKAYFTPDWVGKKLVEIIKDDNREKEYNLYPGDYAKEWGKDLT